MNGITVYGDVLFLINFSMDFLVLFCVSKILHLKQKPWLIVLSSALGGVYGVAALFIENVFLTVVCNIAAAAVMCLIAFPRARGFTFLKCSALFYGISLLTGGGITAAYLLLHRIWRGADVNPDTPAVLSDIPLGTFCILGVVSVIASYVTGRIFGRQSGKKEIKVRIKGKRGEAVCRCLSDSGALLCEPLTGSPVIIVKLGCIKRCVDGELFTALSSPDLSETAEGLRLIPSRGVGGDRLLPGFQPVSVSIKGCERRAVVAVVAEDDLGGFDGIVPASLCI